MSRVGGRAVPANGGNIYDHFEVNYLFPNGYRVFLANRQSTGCYNGTHDYIMGTDGTLVLGVGQPRIETPDGKVKWQFEGEQYDMYQREHDVLFAVDPVGQAEERRSQPGDQHAAGDHGPQRRVLRSADHLGSGDELTGEPGAEAGRLDREARGAGPGAFPAARRLSEWLALQELASSHDRILRLTEATAQAIP